MPVPFSPMPPAAAPTPSASATRTPTWPACVSITYAGSLSDAAVHVGQAAYARGVLEGWRIGY